MMNIPNKQTNKFPYYLRQCDRCDEFFKSPTKKRRLCKGCKIIVNNEKIEKSLKARGYTIKMEIKIKRVENNDIS